MWMRIQVMQVSAYLAIGFLIYPVFGASVSVGQTLSSAKVLSVPETRTRHIQNCTIQLSDLEAKLQRDESDFQAWYERGICQGRLGQQSGKVLSLRQALTLAPDLVPARHQLILALRWTGQTEKAQAEVAVLRRYDPELASDLHRLLKTGSVRRAPMQPRRLPPPSVVK